MNHDIAQQIHLLSEEGVCLSVVVCKCGEKFRARSTDEASRKQWNHMIEKERGK